MLAVFTGGVLLSAIVVLNGIIGARLHTPFAVSFFTLLAFPRVYSLQLR